VTDKQVHPRLARPPVVEALFELRFTPLVSYGLLPGRLFDSLQKDFPESEELGAASLPLDVPMPGLVRHRFKSADGTKLYQTGNGVLSVNHTAYGGYDDLRRDVELVLDAVVALDAVGQVERLGVRYINRMLLDRAWNEVTTATYGLPAFMSARVEGRQLHYTLKYDKDTMDLALGDVSVEATQMLQLDLDYHRENANQTPERDAIMMWLDAAHDSVYQAFTGLLTEAYFAEIK
jgi:uncharacterized protein (TIGR04255 family)